MKRRILWAGVALVLVAAASTFIFAVPAMPATKASSSLPTAKVVRAPLKLTVYANGEIRAGRVVTLVVPPAGGTLRIVTLVSTGTNVKAGDVVFELDPADQQFAL